MIRFIGTVIGVTGVTTPVHEQAREDILSPRAIGTLSAGAVSAMSAVRAAVIEKHKRAMD